MLTDRRGLGQALAPFAIVVVIRLAASAFPSAFWGPIAALDLPSAAGAALFTAWLCTLARPWVGESTRSGIRRYGSVIAVIVSLAAWVACFRDQVQFIGDSQLRHGALERGLFLTRFPQTMPGESWLYGHALPGIASLCGIELGVMWRAVALLDLVCLGCLAAWLVSRFSGSFRSAARASLVASCGVALVMAAGGGKGTAEAAVLAFAYLALSYVCLSRSPASTRTWIAADLLLVLAILMHRSCVLLVPGHVGVWWWRRRRVPLALLGLLAIGAVLGAYALPIFLTFDRAHHIGRTLGAVLDSSVRQWRERVYLALVYFSPLLVATYSTFRSSAAPRADSTIRITALWIVPVLLLLLVATPQQGVFRDADVFALAGVCGVVPYLWMRSAALSDSPSHPALHGLLTTWLVLQSVSTVLIFSEPKAAVRWVTSYASEAEWLDAPTHAGLFEYVGHENDRTGVKSDAKRAYARQWELAPSTRAGLLYSAALAAGREWSAVDSVLRRIQARDTSNVLPRLAMAGVAFQASDTASVERQLDSVLRAASAVKARELAIRLGLQFPSLMPAAALEHIQRRIRSD